MTQVGIVVLLFILFISLTLLYRRIANSNELCGQEQLLEHARSTYNSSRGKKHLDVLRHVDYRITAEIERLQASIDKEQRSLEKARIEFRNALIRSASLLVIRQHLHEVQRIGSTYAETIERSVFRNSLSDLHRSSQVLGIGEKTQAAISRWIREQEPRVVALIEGDLPDKEELTRTYTKKRMESNEQIQALLRQQQGLIELKETLQREILRLQTVRIEHFEERWVSKSASQPDLDFFFLGSYSPTEPMPTWLIQAMQVANVPIWRIRSHDDTG